MGRMRIDDAKCGYCGVTVVGGGSGVDSGGEDGLDDLCWVLIEKREN